MPHLVQVDDNEMEIMQNAMAVYLEYLQSLQKGLSEEGVDLEGIDAEDAQEVEIVISDIFAESYVDAKAMRLRLVTIAGEDMTIERGLVSG